MSHWPVPGTAGLIAAVRLLEAGKSVVLFEKQDIAGGSMPDDLLGRRGGGIAAAIELCAGTTR